MATTDECIEAIRKLPTQDRIALAEIVRIMRDPPDQAQRIEQEMRARQRPVKILEGAYRRIG